MPSPSRVAQPSRPPAAAPRASGPARQPSRAITPGPSAQPPRQIAYDPGYNALGGPAAIIVQAKPSWSRPGSVTGAVVVAFILAGLSLFGAIGWFTTSQFADGADRVGIETGSKAGEAMVYGFVNLLVCVTLILGAVGALGRQEWGRIALCVGAGVDAMFSMYRIAVPYSDFGGRNFGLLIFVVLDILVIALILLPTSTAFLRSHNPVNPMAVPRGYR